MPKSKDELNQSLANACVTLGLAPPFGADKAKSRFRELAKLYHPDVGIVKDSHRFAEISRSYDLMEAHFDALKKTQLTVATDAKEINSRIEELLQQLHEARAKTVNAEASARQMTEESQALRRHYRGTGKASKRIFWGAVLICAAALFFGFMAGMIWSSTSPIIPMKANQILSGTTEITTHTLEHIPNAPLTPALVNVNWQGNLQYEITLETGKVRLNGGTATIDTTPTLKIVKLPELQMTLATPTPTPPAVIPTPTPTPPPAPTPTPTATPAPPKQPQPIEPIAPTHTPPPTPNPSPSPVTTSPTQTP